MKNLQSKMAKPPEECKKLFSIRPFTADVTSALRKYLGHPKNGPINRSIMLRKHELVKLMGGNPLSIKMLASYLKQ